MAERLELREVAGRWRWFFVDADEGIELPSNDDYSDPQEARAAALKAYPDLHFTDAGRPEEGAPRRRPWLLLVLASLCFLGLLFVILRSD